MTPLFFVTAFTKAQSHWKCFLHYLMYFPIILSSSVSLFIKITFGLMESSLQLLRLTDTRQCQPFWHVVSLLLFRYIATIWKLRLPAFSGPWALMTHEDAPQCLFPWWEADTLISVCPDGVADTVIKVGWRERLRESMREKEGKGRDARKKRWSSSSLIISLLFTVKGREGAGLLSSPRLGPLSLGQHPTNLPSPTVWQRASLSWSELRHCKDMHLQSNTPRKYCTMQRNDVQQSLWESVLARYCMSVHLNLYFSPKKSFTQNLVL